MVEGTSDQLLCTELNIFRITLTPLLVIIVIRLLEAVGSPAISIGTFSLSEDCHTLSKMHSQDCGAINLDYILG
ncbi:unnamed protein product [Urochloa humidicola]